MRGGSPRDMLAQAEHDVDASSILLTTSRALAASVAEEIERQLAILPHRGRRAAFDRKQRSDVIVDAMEQAVEFSNALAPELWRCTTRRLLGGIRHAGAVFLGPSSPEAAGDYASGPNHVLPTSGRGAIARRTVASISSR